MLFRTTSRKAATTAPEMVQEAPGFFLNLSEHLDRTAINAAYLTQQRYSLWKQGGYKIQPTDYKRRYFCISVSGGNTLKAHYKALLFHHCWSVDWVGEVRFFFLEDTSGEQGRESSRDSLVSNFIQPLCSALEARHGSRRLCKLLDIPATRDSQAILDHVCETMMHPIDMAAVRQALDDDKKRIAGQLARRESQRYARLLRKHLGATMSSHLVLTGIGKDGEVGSFDAYSPQLNERNRTCVVIKRPSGALRVAQGRSVLTAADCISLIIAGSLKLNALGRFEMEESADFEQTVRETPIRMLRETREIAEKVNIFADQRALHFEESVFSYREQEEAIEIRAEVRDGLFPDGVHMLLLHGFMGLFSFINLLIRLPSAWRTSALHRGSFAKTLPRKRIFPHYANALRKIMLSNWQAGRPVPAAFHSIAGIISDHLLLSIAGETGEMPAYKQLSKPNQQLIDALRSSGLVHLASFAASDGLHHININGGILKRNYLKGEPLDYSSTSGFYLEDEDGKLHIHPDHDLPSDSQVKNMDKMLALPGTKAWVSAMNKLWRQAIGRRDVQRKLLNSEQPYALRIIGSRLLKKISMYGLLKEISGAMHNPRLYQQRHIRALEALVHYDIPYLSIIHQDDFMVSANRHREEHEILLRWRMKKEKVKNPEDLQTQVRLMLLERESEDLPLDPLNPHLLVMATTDEGNRLVRRITAEITDFVHHNVSVAVRKGLLAPVNGVPTGRRRKAG